MPDNVTPKTNTIPQQPSPQSGSKRPNEVGALHVEGFLRITDPNTKETYVETRA
jgi:hypothetical protein